MKNNLIWDKIFKSKGWGKYPAEDLVRFIAKNFDKKKKKSKINILEIGCGPGGNLSYFAKEGFNIQLAARNSNSLKDECSNIMIRHNVKSTIHELNILDYDSHEKFLNSLPELPTVVLSAIGLLDNRNESVGNINKTVLIIRTNFEGIVILISKIAKKFVKIG